MPVTFNAATQRYVVNGKTVAPRAVRGLVEKDLDLSRARMQDLGRRLQSGDLTTLQFRKQMQAEISSLHVAHSAAGYGGWASMTPQRWGKVGSAVRKQNTYLEKAIADAADPDYLQSKGFIARLGMYADAGVAAFEVARRESNVAAGYTECRNVEDADAKHCEGPDSCPEQTAKGWVPVDEMVQIGARACGPRCRCELIYRKGAD